MGKRIIITSGPTNERIDAVMKITNMSTGALGARIAEKILGTPEYAEQVDVVYYVSQKLAKKPVVPDGQTYKLREIQVESTQDLLNTMGALLRNPDEHIDAVIHSAAVGDYKGRYVARAEDLSKEIAKTVMNAPFGIGRHMDASTVYDAVLSVLTQPKCVQDDATKISSYEPNLMCMLDLTPKVIGHIKDWSPSTMLIGFKLLEGVTNNHLFCVASEQRQKNHADYVMANDLARIGNGRHWGMVIGRNGIVTECNDKDEIADVLSRLVFGMDVDYNCYSQDDPGAEGGN